MACNEPSAVVYVERIRAAVVSELSTTKLRLDKVSIVRLTLVRQTPGLCLRAPPPPPPLCSSASLVSSSTQLGRKVSRLQIPAPRGSRSSWIFSTVRLRCLPLFHCPPLHILLSRLASRQQPAARSPHPGPRGPSALLCPPRWHARLSRSALVLAPADARHLSVPPHKVSPAPPKPNLALSPTTMPVSNEAGVKLEPASMSNSSQTPPATGAAAPGDETCMLHRSPPVPSPFRPCLRARGFGRPGPVVLC